MKIYWFKENLSSHIKWEVYRRVNFIGVYMDGYSIQIELLLSATSVNMPLVSNFLISIDLSQITTTETDV